MAAHNMEEDEVEITDPGEGDRTVGGEYTPIRGIPALDVQRIVEGVCARIEADVHERIAEALGGGGGGFGGGFGGFGGPPAAPPEPPAKTFLGLDLKGWGGWAVKLAVVAAGASFAWYTWVNDSIKDRPTKAESRKMDEAAIAQHEAFGTHPRTNRILEAHSEQLKTLSDIQIQQTQILENQANSIVEMKSDIRRRR